jgi:hypothetical protein
VARYQVSVFSSVTGATYAFRADPLSVWGMRDDVMSERYAHRVDADSYPEEDPFPKTVDPPMMTRVGRMTRGYTRGKRGREEEEGGEEGRPLAPPHHVHCHCRKSINWRAIMGRPRRATAVLPSAQRED